MEPNGQYLEEKSMISGVGSDSILYLLNNVKNLFILIYFLFNLLQYGSAQGPFIKNFTTQDGLPSNTVYQIYQDSKKFLWFTTDAGVVKYDGTNFITYRKKDGLSSNDVVRIKEDACGRIWFMNISGSLDFLFEGKIYNESNAKFLKFLKSRDFFIDFYEDSSSVLYFYNRYGEVISLDSNYFVKKYNIGNLHEGSPINWLSCLYMYIHNMYKDRNGEFIFWTSCGIFKLKSLTGERIYLDSTIGVSGVFNNWDSILIVNSQNYGLQKYNHSLNSSPIKISFDNKKIKTALIDNKGILWLAAFDAGVYCIDGQKTIKHIPIDNALGLLQDIDNNIWISSMTNGLFRVNYNILTHKYIDKITFDNSGIKKFGYCFDNQGIWCSNGGVLYKYYNKKTFKLDLRHLGNSLDIINHVHRDMIYVGQRSNKLYLIDGLGISNEHNLITFKSIFLYPNNVKKIIVDTTSNQLITFDQTFVFFSQLFSKENKINRRYVGERIYNILRNSNGQLVINGARNYTYSQSNINRKFGLNKFSGRIIIDNQVVNDSVEFYNFDGDSVYLKYKDEFYNITAALDLPIDYFIKRILYHNSKLFIVTTRYIFVCEDPIRIINHLPLKLYNINISYELINDIIVYQDSIFIASSDGLTIISENLYRNNPAKAPLPYITRISINDKELVQIDNIIETVGRKRISITFSNLSYSSDKVISEYVLKSTLPEWRFNQINGNSIIFQNLPKGEYIFKLRVRKSNSDWSKPIQLKIIIKPTFYEYPIFWVGVVIVLAFIAFLIALRIKTVRANKVEMNHKLIQNEQRALLSMMNPHFIFNSLGSIQNYMLKNKVGEAIIFLTQFGRLIRQNVRAVNVNIIEMDDEVERIKNYLELEQIRLENNFDYFIEMEESFMEDVFYVPSMIIQPFVENSIWHGIANIDFRGIIRVKFVVESDKLIKVIVEDNGIGMKRAHAIPSDTRFHLRMSMEITQRRLKLLREKYEANSHIEHSELYPGNVCPGTRTTIYLPYSCKKPEIEYTIQGVE